MTLTHANIDYALVAAKLSAVLGRKWGVRVLFGGNPKTDGQTITLPHWPMDDPLMRGALHGLIAHEAGGHVRRTDFPKLAVHARSIRWPFPIWKSFENILEDIRIEANLLREYPGVRVYLDMAVRVMFELDTPAPVPAETVDYWSTVQNWCLAVFRHDFLGQRDLAANRGEIDALAGRLLDRSVLDEAYAIGRAAADLPGERTNFASLLELADRLTQLFMEAQVPDALPPEQEQGSEGADGTATDGASDASGDADADGASDASDADASGGGDSAPNDAGSGPSDGETGPQSTPGQSGADPSTEGSDGEAGATPQASADSGAGEGTSSGSGVASPADTDKADKAAPAGGATVDKTEPTHARGDLFEAICEAVGPGEKQDVPVIGASDVASSPVKTDVLIDVFRRSAPMAQRLVPALAPMIVGECWDEAQAKSGRKFSADRLSRVKTDADPAVFCKRVVEDDQSVAFHVLVDRSGSTKDILPEIREATLALVSALEMFPQVATAISHFPTLETYGGRATYLTKPFGTPLRQSLERWPLAEGGTPLAQALEETALSFALVEQVRRIVVVVTDGKPKDADMVRLARKSCQMLGVEVIGLVVGCDSYPLDLFDDSTKIDTVADMATALHALVLRNI